VLGLGYALVTGFEAPVQRAFALFAVWLLARVLDWECEAPTSLAAGALAILLAQPGALWEAGFQLSFACTLAVLLVMPPLAQKLPSRWPRWARLALAGLASAQLALIPLLAFHFHQLAWPGLLASLVSGLFTAGILGLGLPLAVFGAWLPAVGALLAWPLTKLVLLLDHCAGRMAQWPYAAYSTGLIPAWVLVLPLLWALVFLGYGGPARRSLLSGLLLGLLTLLLWQGLPFAQRHPGETRLWMLDVGQGDSLLLRFEDGRHLLVDGGAAQPDAGAWVVVPALRALGVQRLDWVLATHPDADHIGGLAWVLDQVPAGLLMTNGQGAPTQAWQAVLAAAARRGVPQRSLRSDLPRQPDEGPWIVLNPSPKRPSKRKRKAKARPHNNDLSVVLRVEDWLLLTGDLPKAGEKRLLKRGLQRVEVLKAGHHGSKGSSSPAFIRALRPAESLLSSGAFNRFGHPAPQALAALKKSRLWRTDLQGCVALVKRRGERVQVRPWREADEAALRQPHGPYRSPWRGLEARKRRAWSAFRAAAAPADEDEPGPEDGDAS
jgi:competence protein ComEC